MVRVEVVYAAKYQLRSHFFHALGGELTYE